MPSWAVDAAEATTFRRWVGAVAEVAALLVTLLARGTRVAFGTEAALDQHGLGLAGLWRRTVELHSADGYLPRTAGRTGPDAEADDEVAEVAEDFHEVGAGELSAAGSPDASIVLQSQPENAFVVGFQRFRPQAVRVGSGLWRERGGGSEL